MTPHEYPRLVGIQVGMPRELSAIHGDISEKPWTTGFHKHAIETTCASRTGLAGDGQADLIHHGGPDKAICTYSIAHYPFWQAVLGVESLAHGAFGENFTVAGITEADVCIGDTWQVGADVVVQISQPRQPCWKLARRWQRKTLALEVQEAGKTGWYFRVLREGAVQAGLTLTLLERPHPAWTVARANHVMHIDKQNHALAGELAALPELSASWQHALAQRAADNTQSKMAADKRRLDG